MGCGIGHRLSNVGVWEEMQIYETKIWSRHEKMQNMRSPFYMAEEVEAGLGGGAVLLPKMPQNAPLSVIS